MKTYITVMGDTFDLIALKFYGSALQVQALYAANEEHLGKWRFVNGETVRIPDESESFTATVPIWRQ